MTVTSYGLPQSPCLCVPCLCVACCIICSLLAVAPLPLCDSHVIPMGSSFFISSGATVATVPMAPYANPLHSLVTPSFVATITHHKDLCECLNRTKSIQDGFPWLWRQRTGSLRLFDISLLRMQKAAWAATAIGSIWQHFQQSNHQP